MAAGHRIPQNKAYAADSWAAKPFPVQLISGQHALAEPSIPICSIEQR
jgi:hypothetical protein